MATLSGILYIITLFREIIRLVTSLAIKSITDSTLILSSNSEVTISLDNSSRRGDSVFSSNLRSSCFNKEPASDSTLERISLNCLKTEANSLLIRSIPSVRELELIITLDMESSSNMCGISPLPLLSGATGVAEHGV
ncbi:unnamed protein product [Schistosoma rodhaini]|uniref:hypothetical protein n=1 Tax=Schistosoma mansoni TaxID=6183 RepID=UPI00022C8587|nr:hypothetical protein Smp_187110 [Schistosoma mansoni]CAH8574955.1 unnamed protein product [Schistosoma rodhaini]|eukprot:XP_018647323.1 hypothetical protein Smp_187110 [Schistosoma mansoni]